MRRVGPNFSSSWPLQRKAARRAMSQRANSQQVMKHVTGREKRRKARHVRSDTGADWARGKEGREEKKEVGREGRRTDAQTHRRTDAQTHGGKERGEMQSVNEREREGERAGRTRDERKRARARRVR
eukprot:2159173-Rhodomonas_salina.1